MSATDRSEERRVGTECRVRESAPGEVVIATAAGAVGGGALGSLEPNSAALKVWVASSSTLTVLSAPAGGSFRQMTSVCDSSSDVCASELPLAVVPSSCTWKVKVA